MMGTSLEAKREGTRIRVTRRVFEGPEVERDSIHVMEWKQALHFADEIRKLVREARIEEYELEIKRLREEK